ncbi:hypothetical protein WICPIJ_004293 [Wickerhamomyces pijperi]|uniref:Uncharacterized protein n=1 Tax=Wickerhamomyces pijperi TaxID=599730 RepID=A0A9P8Q816_WICPI|nr:hypothetical protein WICPIJ_004293 [Wickerhamomyces pijperi]
MMLSAKFLPFGKVIETKGFSFLKASVTSLTFLPTYLRTNSRPWGKNTPAGSTALGALVEVKYTNSTLPLDNSTSRVSGETTR